MCVARWLPQAIDQGGQFTGTLLAVAAWRKVHSGRVCSRPAGAYGVRQAGKATVNPRACARDCYRLALGRDCCRPALGRHARVRVKACVHEQGRSLRHMAHGTAAPAGCPPARLHGHATAVGECARARRRAQHSGRPQHGRAQQLRRGDSRL